MKKADELLETLATYTHDFVISSDAAFQTARLSLADALGCAILSLKFKECTKLLGPIVPNTTVPHGSHVPGTSFILDPVRAAFNIGSMIRWLDFNDTWLAAEWGHPSDNLGGILAIADHESRKNIALRKHPWTVDTVLEAMIKAHEIQGCLALLNSFNRIGFDHVILVKIATTAVATKLLGGSKNQIINALSNAWIDTGPLRTYRHTPNTGSRKSWAAGDATSRGVWLAMMTMRGEMGYPTALTAKRWGLNDVLFQGKPLLLEKGLGSYVMENVLFKIAFPAEFHAQTAVECAFKLHPSVKEKLDSIEEITIETHESAIRIIDKEGPLDNPADRDHCLQYMVAIGLIFGNLIAEHYEDDVAKDPRIDILRRKMRIKENKSYSIDYLDPQKRSIANAITIQFTDGTKTERIAIDYPLGHPRRRNEGIPLLFQKFEANLSSKYASEKVAQIKDLFLNHERLRKMPVNTLIDLFN